MESEIDLPANGWEPRPYQRGLWNFLESGGKRAIEIAHRRWGKDDVALHWAAISAFQKVATYWHMLPEYAQARKAIWNAVNPHTGKRRIDEAFPAEIRETTNDHEMFIRFVNGSTWQVVGSDSYNSLVGTPPYGIVISEWALADPAVWAYLDPILEENGGWALFITTPRGKNHAYGTLRLGRRSDEWFAEVQTVRETGFPMERVEKAKETYIEMFGKEAAEALIEQEYFCSFDAAILGAVYGKWMADATKEGRITDRVKHDPDYPVYTAWDLGYDDATAVWFYQVGHNEILMIDYFEGNGMDVQALCEMLYGREIKIGHINPQTKEIEAWEFGDWIPEHEHRKHYSYHEFHYVPHDAGHKLQSAGGRSIVAQAKEFGIKMAIIPATSMQNSVQALRKTLPKCWFAETRCERGIEGLKAYHYKYDEEKRVFSKDPLHDDSSHPCDAAEIMGRIHTEAIVSEKQRKAAKIEAEFFRKRRENNLDQEDPYRTKKVRKR